MREILFRGKRINGEWAEGWYYKRILWPCNIVDAIQVYDGKNLSSVQYHAVIPETIGQFTGMTDKNGKRIFEGDIIKTHYANTPKADFIEQVVFHNGRFCGMYEHDKMKMWASLADGIKHLPQDKSVYMEWCEVIGNIHDNPELLKGGD